MTEVSNAIREFFTMYAKATNSLDLLFFASAYAETFMFAGPGGVQAVRREDFLKVVPRRKALFEAVGLVASLVSDLQETTLDDRHILVRTRWSLRFEKEGMEPIADDTAATYILRRHEGSLQIVFQIDHQDLTKRAQELGLLPRHDQ